VSSEVGEEDQGLVMKLDSRISPGPVAAVPKLCGPQTVSGLALVLTSTSVFQAIPDVFLKKIIQVGGECVPLAVG